MSSAKITLIGLYNYMKATGDDLFYYLDLPEGVSKETLINTILLNGGEYESLYADPNFIKSSIAVWSDKWYHTISRWLRAITEEYDPLHNYDRTEEEIRTPDITKTRTADIKNERTTNLSDNRSIDLSSKRETDLTDTAGGKITEENTVSAYDSSSYQPDSKKITTPENTLTTKGSEDEKNTGTDNIKHTGTDTNKETGTDINTEKGSEKWNRRAFGNIGVTTSQQMLESELKISVWSLYDSIARLFLSEYVIPIMC